MKVLDLGAHDGFVTAGWLARQDARPTDLRIDGVELHPRGVDEFNRRLKAAGVPGECKQGLAEEAPRLFEMGTYDAVVLYELIEHVPDMNRLLSQAERMLAPGGRIYVSTPDGCFGDGNNPHHLRALRAVDLADLLRRRGRLVDMEVGPDGITSACYTPGTRHSTCTIYTGGGWEQWSPADIDRRGLGGSETAAVRLAEALEADGWVVTVYGEVEDCCWRDGVIFRHHSTFDPLDQVDLLISSRLPEIFDRPTRARTRMLWMHDTDCGNRLTPLRATRIDHVLVLSRWHEAHVQGMYPFLAGRVRRIHNGIDPDRFTGNVGERQRRVLYTSSPDRGLDVLLELWPQVRERVPDAVLNACYSPVYWRVAEQDALVGAHAARVRELAEQPGVELLPSQSQPALARLMRESLVWTAPSFNTPHNQPFQETSCIGAMEAQAAGCHVVASNWGALPETVRTGALIDGDPLSDGWKRAFVDEIVRGLTDPDVQERAQTEGPEAVSDMRWDVVGWKVQSLALAPPDLKAAA